MSIYDPPSDPEYCAHPCPYCDQEMEQEWRARYSDYICVNPECEYSPKYQDAFTCCECDNEAPKAERVYSHKAGGNTYYRCQKCDAEIKAESLEMAVIVGANH